MAPEKNIPVLCGWVGKFLHFAIIHPGYSFEQTLDYFLKEIGERKEIQPWQIRQASNAIRIYRFQFRKNPEPEKHLQNNFKDFDINSLITRLKKNMHLRHYSPRTEKSYINWTTRFLKYQQATGVSKWPSPEDVKAYLTRLAMVENVSASTQNLAFNAILLFFHEVLHSNLEDISNVVRAKRGRKLPIVLSVNEVRALIKAIDLKYKLMVELLYGSGLRLVELLTLRVKDVDFDAGLLFVKSGKGDKDRTTLLPASLYEALKIQMNAVRKLHENDLRLGHGAAPLPFALSKKYPNAAREFG